MFLGDNDTIQTKGNIMKTTHLIALLSLITFSANAEELQTMTQEQAKMQMKEQHSIQTKSAYQMDERYVAPYGAKEAKEREMYQHQTQMQNRIQTQMQNQNHMVPSQMQNQMQNMNMQRGGGRMR